MLAGHVWLDWRFLRHMNLAVISQYASTRDIWLISSADKSSPETPRSKTIVSTYAWCDWGNYDVGLSYKAWISPARSREFVCIAMPDSCQSTSWRVMFYVGMVLVGRRLNLWRKPNSLKSEALICDQHCQVKDRLMFQLPCKRNARCLSSSLFWHIGWHDIMQWMAWCYQEHNALKPHCMNTIT